VTTSGAARRLSPTLHDTQNSEATAQRKSVRFSMSDMGSLVSQGSGSDGSDGSDRSIGADHATGLRESPASTLASVSPLEALIGQAGVSGTNDGNREGARRYGGRRHHRPRSPLAQLNLNAVL